MDIPSFRDLLTPAGQQALSAAAALTPREEDFLAHFTALKRQFPAGLARAALETAILRQLARSKFPFAESMYFTREALEQASSWEISLYRAQRYLAFKKLIDLGCSIGGDTLALASHAPSLGIDLDPLRLQIARANAQALGLEERVAWIQADLTRALPISLSHPPFSLSGSCALFFDPARRRQGRRAHSVEAYLPRLSIIQDWLVLFPALGVKISPGVDLDELAGYSAEIEFISLHGELKEAVLWFGSLRTAQRRATVLPGPHTLASQNRLSPFLPLSEPQGFLYEPDPAILRAGLVADLGEQLEAFQLDASIAYLTANRATDTPFARCWRIEDWFPFGLKRLRAYLRAQGIGKVVVKKRGSPIQPEALIRDLRLRGDKECILFLTQLRARPIVIIAAKD